MYMHLVHEEIMQELMGPHSTLIMRTASQAPRSRAKDRIPAPRRKYFIYKSSFSYGFIFTRHIFEGLRRKKIYAHV